MRSDLPTQPLRTAGAAAAAAGLLALGLTAASDGPGAWLGGLAALSAGIASATLGLRGGAPFALAAAALPWLLPGAGGAFAWAAEAAHPALMAALAWLAGAASVRSVRRRESGAAAGERRTRVLVEAALELGTVEGERRIYAALPPLVARVLSAHHVAVLRVVEGALEVEAMVPPLLPAGTRIDQRSICGRAARTGITQLVPDARDDPEYRTFGSLPDAVTEIAVPLRAAGLTFAVLNVERSVREPFGPEDRSSLEALARIAEVHLGHLATLDDVERRRIEAGTLAEVARRLAQVDDPRRAASLALSAMVTAVGVDHGIVFVVERGAFRAIALSDDLPPPLADQVTPGIPWGQGGLRHVWKRGESVFDPDDAGLDGTFGALVLRTVALLPVRDTDGGTIALIELVSYGEPRRWDDGERRLLEVVASTLGGVLARANLRQREADLLEVVRQMARSDDAAELYQRVVEAAVRVVPGAEAGSLLVRRPGGGFVFQGATGFELLDLQHAGPMTDEQQFRWYGLSAPDFRSGRPRVLAGDAVTQASVIASDARARVVLDTAGMTSRIRATLCVPVAYQDEVLAMLNVDAFTREDAFDSRSVALAEALAQHVAVIVRQAHDRQALARSALTDPMTGLGNREAFNQTLARELKRSERHGEPVAVAMLDLDGFKEVNDRFGHQAGDRALAAVAQALRSAVRGSDAVFRWGGDEFAVVMPSLAPHDGAHAAERFVAAIARLEVHGLSLAASVGLANYPGDGTDAESLLRRADDVMYAIKGSRQRPPP